MQNGFPKMCVYVSICLPDIVFYLNIYSIPWTNSYMDEVIKQF